MTGLAVLFAWSNYMSGLVLAQLPKMGWASMSASVVFTLMSMGGMFVGSLLGGIIGDAVGRRTSCLLFVGFHALAMYVAALAPSTGMFIVARSFMGFGLDALPVTLFAAFSE